MNLHTRVNVKQGTVVGLEGLLPNGRSYQYFRGIPYAAPPVGELRFEPPIPLKTFATSEIDCTKEGDVSLQRDPLTGKIVGSENCLFLNIYAPKPKLDAPMPVMVYLHGGAYMYGSGNGFHYTPLYLIQEDVIVVTLNYRLGALGFLSLPEANIPGNMGLKDQHLALRWVNENISKFNGDPKNVTVFGESAGGCCTHFHLLSESSKKLFHKAILQSGTANMKWATLEKAPTKTIQLAKLLGCKLDDPLEVIKHLKNYPNLTDFIKYAPSLISSEDIRRSTSIPLRPSVEKLGTGAIVTEDPLHAMNKPNSIDIPLMIGYNSAEGILFLLKASKKLSTLDNDLAAFVPERIILDQRDPKYLELKEKIRDLYFKGGKVDEQKLNALADAYGDFQFILDSNIAAEVHSRKQHKSPLYFYRFDYSGGLNKYKQIFGFDHLNGACHGDELFYLFQSDLAKEPWAEKDKRMVEKMCKLWANFAKYGNPTPDKNDRFVDCLWEPVPKVGEGEKFNLNAFIIDEKQRMLDNPDARRIDFWRDVDRTYNSTSSSKL